VHLHEIYQMPQHGYITSMQQKSGKETVSLDDMGLGYTLRDILTTQDGFQELEQQGSIVYGVQETKKYEKAYIAYDENKIKQYDENPGSFKQWEYIAGFLMVEKSPTRKDWVAWEIQLGWVNPEYRSKGIGKKLHEVAILQDNIILISDDTQSTRATQLKNSLSGNPNITAWVMDINHPEKAYPLQYNKSTGDLHTDKRVYYKKWGNQAEAMRLVFMKRSHRSAE